MKLARMDHFPTCMAVVVAAGTAWLCGCADGPESSETGRRIVADLERAAIPLPNDRGEPQGGGRAGADTAPTLPSQGPIGLTDLWAAAEASNPDLAAARSRVGVAAGRALQASQVPNPTVDVKAEEVPFDEGFSRGISTVGVTQPIILGDRRHAAIDAADAEQRAALARLELRRREVLAGVSLLYGRLVMARDAEELNAELRAVVSQTLTIAQTRFEERAALEIEVLRPRIELDRLDISSAHLARQRRAAAEQLRLLLGGDDVDIDRLGDGPAALTPLDLEALGRSVRSGHPALAVADHEIEAAAARLEGVKAERTPDLDLRIGAGYSGQDEEGIFEIGAGMEIPLWDQRRGDILSARFDLMRARQERRGAENDLLGRLSAAHADYESAREQWVATRERIVPAMQRAFEQTADAYRAGRTGFLDLLDAQRSLAEARLSLLEAGERAGAAGARLVELLGPELFDPGADQRNGNGFRTPRERPSGAEVHP